MAEPLILTATNITCYDVSSGVPQILHREKIALSFAVLDIRARVLCFSS